MVNKNMEDIITINQYLVNHKNNFYKEVGSVIKEIRNYRKIPLEAFSSMAITSNSYACQIEQGNNGLSLLKFVLICNALKVKPKHIIDSFIIYNEDNEDLLYNELQYDKNISRNVFNFIKNRY